MSWEREEPLVVSCPVCEGLASSFGCRRCGGSGSLTGEDAEQVLYEQAMAPADHPSDQENYRNH